MNITEYQELSELVDQLSDNVIMPLVTASIKADYIHLPKNTNELSKINLHGVKNSLCASLDACRAIKEALRAKIEELFMFDRIKVSIQPFDIGDSDCRKIVYDVVRLDNNKVMHTANSMTEATLWALEQPLLKLVE